MSDVGDSAYLSPPVQRAARLLRRIADGDAVTNMTRTAREVGINRTTLLRLLHTLEAERFIEPRGEGAAGWRIGNGLVGITAQAFFAEDLVQAAMPALTQLAEMLGLSAHLGILDGRQVVYVLRRTPDRPLVSNVRVGSRLPAHAANMGRIMLAHCSAAQVARLFADGDLPARTQHTATTLGQLRARLDADRAAGLAWSDGHYEPGVSSVAAAVLDATGAPVAAINVSGQTASFEGEKRRQQIGHAIATTAAELSRRLGWHRTASAA